MPKRTPGGLPPLNPPRKSRRGFAAMDPEKLREIARKGGAAVPGHLRSFSQDRTLAAEAGTKGGRAKADVLKPRLSTAEANRQRRLDRAREDD